MHEHRLPRTGQNIALRRLTSTDLAAFQAYRQDAELGRYQGWAAESDEDAAKFIAEMSQATLFAPGAWIQLGIADRESNALIGDIGIYMAQDETLAEIGFTLATAAQGKGLASEAVQEAMRMLFESTGIEKITASTDQRNTSSIKLLERVGMQRVATVEAIFRGLACIEYNYCLSRGHGVRRVNAA
jgi:ribosomal-protein-alanine N-acetyltransferase